MSNPTGSLPPIFQALENRLAELQARYGRGELDADAYQAEVQGLTVQDGAGQSWWLGGETGTWHKWGRQHLGAGHASYSSATRSSANL